MSSDQLQRSHCYLGIREYLCIINGQFLSADRSLFGKIFSLGVSASIAIVAGSILCFIVCVAGTVCCCFRCSRTRQKNAAAAATLNARPPPPTGLSASGSTGADSAFHGGGFLPMMAVAGGGGAGCGSDRSDLAPSHKYYSVNGGHYSASSGGTASPYNYKKSESCSLTHTHTHTTETCGRCHHC